MRELRGDKHVTLQLLWQEYKQSNPDGYQYSRFCELYQRWAGLEKVFGPALRDYTRIKDYPNLPGEGGQGWVSQKLLHQHSGGLVNLLHYGDALSMANGIESRMPFLDHRLVEFVWSLPSEYKVKIGLGKYIHRQALRGVVPDWVLNQKVKMGFNTPIGMQFKKANKSGVEGPVEVLMSPRCLNRGIFDADALRRLISSHRAGRQDHGLVLFRLLSVEVWFRRFIDRTVGHS
jgi:asparagine synthase (glutamine-hydrolysing)